MSGDVKWLQKHTYLQSANMFGLKQDGWRLSHPHLLPSSGIPDGLLKKSRLTEHSNCSPSKNIEL